MTDVGERILIADRDGGAKTYSLWAEAADACRGSSLPRPQVTDAGVKMSDTTKGRRARKRGAEQGARAHIITWRTALETAQAAVEVTTGKGGQTS